MTFQVPYSDLAVRRAKGQRSSVRGECQTQALAAEWKVPAGSLSRRTVPKPNVIVVGKCQQRPAWGKCDTEITSVGGQKGNFTFGPRVPDRQPAHRHITDG